MKKDFLFLNYSWVWGSTTYFNFFKEKGHSVDIADENTFQHYLSQNEYGYKNIVLYLHEPYQLSIINRFLNTKFRDSFLIQHDDTDFEDVQIWTNREPNLFMQRELTNQTKKNSNNPVIPFHFPMNSIYDEKLNEDKKYDVSFICNMTNQRRKPFVDKIIDLSKNSLSHLNWYIDFGGAEYKPGFATESFKNVVNQSKIGLHYFGNSYDSIRIWEILSCKTALLMPKMRSLSVTEEFIPLVNYESFNDDFSDIESKILYLLENDRWKDLSLKGHNEYHEKHNIQKCCEMYYNKVINYCIL